MRRCPKCGAEIKEIEYRYTATFCIYEIISSDGEKISFEVVDKDLIEVIEESFHCSECEYMITDDYNKAIRILKSSNKSK